MPADRRASARLGATCNDLFMRLQLGCDDMLIAPQNLRRDLPVRAKAKLTQGSLNAMGSNEGRVAAFVRLTRTKGSSLFSLERVWPEMRFAKERMSARDGLLLEPQEPFAVATC